MAKRRISSKESTANILQFAKESDDEEDGIYELMDSDINDLESRCFTASMLEKIISNYNLV